MRYFKSTVLSFLFLFYYGNNLFANSKKYDQFINSKVSTLVNNYDSLIIYYRGCSGACINGLNVSVFLLYKKKNKFILEYYRWDRGSGKLLESFKSKKKSVEVKAILQYVSRNADCLNKENENIYNTNISDGIYSWFMIKLGEKIIRKNLNVTWEVDYYVRNSPCIGSLLLVLNTLHYHNRFDSLNGW